MQSRTKLEISNRKLPKVPQDGSVAQLISQNNLRSQREIKELGRETEKYFELGYKGKTQGLPGGPGVEDFASRTDAAASILV